MNKSSRFRIQSEVSVGGCELAQSAGLPKDRPYALPFRSRGVQRALTEQIEIWVNEGGVRDEVNQ